MTTSLVARVFDYKDSAVRVVMIDEEPWWVASDVAALLGYLPKIMPTQTANDYRGGCKPERSLRMREQSARGLDLPSVLRLLFPDSTGLVRPSWAEARMGYPIGWTECTPSEMPSSRKSRS